MTLIDRDAILDKSWEVATVFGDIRMVSVIDIEDAPTVDAVQVVRCNDCVNWGEEFEHELHLCENFGCMKHANEYCSDGKHREEQDDGK